MSIKNLDFKSYNQDLTVNSENKLLYGEIFTPFSLIEKMFELIPNHLFYDKNLKWLDPGAGTGYFSVYLYFKLFETLKDSIPNDDERRNHIIKYMIYMVEINDNHVEHLKEVFGEDSNIFNYNFLEVKIAPEEWKFDVVIGNPPFNYRGIKKVPTNTKLKKKHDGATIWGDFVKRGMSLLKNDGYLCYITPSIWMKPDKSRLYHYIRQFKILKLHALNNTKTNQIFKGEAQTPCAYYLLKKCAPDGYVDLFDYDQDKYVTYSLKPEIPIPVFGSSIVKKFCNKVNPSNKLKVYKSNLPSKNCILSDVIKKNYYINIHTCKLNKTTPELVIKYSSKPCHFYGKTKLVMAHGMYGFPTIDKGGLYGISNRDKYVILRDDTEDLLKLQKFFSTKTALYLFESTRYRMKYLEKYIFELIPDITKLDNFPEDINDETIASYFGLTDEEKNAINSLHKKEYNYFKK